MEITTKTTKKPNAKAVLAKAQALKVKGDCLAEAAELQEAVLHLLKAAGKWGARRFAEEISYLPDAIREMQPRELRESAGGTAA